MHKPDLKARERWLQSRFSLVGPVLSFFARRKLAKVAHARRAGEF
jgi:hypothetical protein